MTLSELKPQSKQLVYDLVTQAGIDTSDWANYRRPESPATNPRCCYEWAFVAADRVVLCLWFLNIQEDGTGVFQVRNYRETRPEHREWNTAQKKRAWRMDRAFVTAWKKRLPVRVIVVDGPPEQAVGEVERRMLDPEPWHIAKYDNETGQCRIQRGPWPEAESGPAAKAAEGGTYKLARIAYNSAGWQRPTGEAGDHESAETYNAKNRFGHEDWLFRGEWVIDGWRYAFIQGLNNSRQAYFDKPLDVTLFTIQPDKSRRLVATINGLESLSDEQADAALEAFREKGWLKTMQDEVRAIDGNADALGAPRWAAHVLNVRYRLENMDSYPPETLLRDDEWIRDRHRYMLYKFGESDRERVERDLPGRQGTQVPPEVRRLFRRGTNPVEYTPEHDKMQAKLMAELQKEYGPEFVMREQDFVDVRVETEKELVFFEIKTDLDPRAVIRQALGQILEYAFHPSRTGRRPDSLVIVGRSPLTEDDETYLQRLRDEFKLPLSYRVVPI